MAKMSMEQALKLVTGPRYAIRNMARALNMARWWNTPEDELRLQAAIYVLRNWTKYIKALEAKRTKPG